ncbi:MAG: DinB family protein [Gemmatimonadetes bacterium]|nr:DinB family protein [Gemmatimonadota bacterium]
MSTDRLLQEVEAARSALVAYLEPMEPEDAHTPIGEGRWSPIEYLEHLVRAEEATVWRMFKAVEEERRGLLGPRSSTPGDTIEQVVERTWEEREEAPPLAVPRLGGAMSYWLERMKRNTDLLSRFASMVREEELDVFAYEHPISGPFTLRQGIDFVRFHIDRHHAHLREALGTKK